MSMETMFLCGTTKMYVCLGRLVKTLLTTLDSANAPSQAYLDRLDILQLPEWSWHYHCYLVYWSLSAWARFGEPLAEVSSAIQN